MLVILKSLAATGCGYRAELPSEPPRGAAIGLAPAGFDRSRACASWVAAAPDDEAAHVHDSFPELHPAGCHIPVHYDAGGPRPGAIPEGCGYPGASADAAIVSREADRYARVASEGPTTEPLPPELACGLPDRERALAARWNERTLRKLARRVASGRRYPYAAVGAFGFGSPRHAESALVAWRPGDACVPLDKRQMDLLDVNVARAGRAAAAHQAKVGPVVTVSGGAVHSPLYEAFALAFLATCRFGVRPDAVLLDPCADHTHTNLRNTGSLIVAIGGRTAYIVTDDGLQADYLQEWNGFHLVGGSIDRRALRDFGHLLGSFRQASVGIEAGFWFTPYRFWASPEGDLGSFTCVR